MKISRRIFLPALLGALTVFLGIIFYPFLLENIVLPVATVLLLFWRVLESLDQVLYWGFLISGFLFFGFIRLMQLDIAGEEISAGPQNILLEEIRAWRTSIRFACEDFYISKSLKQDVEKMTAGAFAVDRPSAPPLTIREALRKGELPLPGRLHRFLYADDPGEAQPSLRQRAAHVLAVPGKWIRRLTGRERADYYRSLKEILNFLEDWMEIKNGDEYFDAPDH